MKSKRALKIIGGLSKPSKMPGWAYGLPAKECKTGSKLVKVKNSVCEGCYALKGCYVFKVVQAAQYRRLRSIKKASWIPAMVEAIRSKRSNYFRWHDSGDVQDKEHLFKIFAVCKLTPNVKHWMPTREAWVKTFLKLKPSNLVIRFSAPMVDMPAPDTWPNTSTVVTSGPTCPAPLQDNECKDCRSCWDPAIKNVSYGKH